MDATTIIIAILSILLLIAVGCLVFFVGIVNDTFKMFFGTKKKKKIKLNPNDTVFQKIRKKQRS